MAVRLRAFRYGRARVRSVSAALRERMELTILTAGTRPLGTRDGKTVVRLTIRRSKFDDGGTCSMLITEN